MIERLQRIATVLSRIRALLLLLAAISLCMMVLSMLENPWLNQDTWLIPASVALMWFLTLYSLSHLFLSVPAPVEPDMGWRARLSRKLRRAVAWLAPLLFLMLTAALLVLTYQLLRVALF